PSSAQLATGGAFAAVIVAWPFFAEAVAEFVGVRPFACAVLALGALSALGVRGALPAELHFRWLDTALLGGLVLAAALTGRPVFLWLVPAWIYAALARLFEASARAESSLIERAAFLLQPHAPEFIRPYCRRVTRLWAAIFLANALAIAALALFAPLAWWRAWTGWMVWPVFAAISAVEFAVRKAHFRIYDDGPVDAVFERLFPAADTEMGRRSNEYKREMRRALGRPERGR
ncbi:MAG TPA: hypothetical protein VEI82_01975, partial [Myxococcota bacterium]|nr:hypothetical protein [Myxococcota bacterium]